MRCERLSRLFVGAVLVCVVVSCLSGCSTSVSYPREGSFRDDSPLCLRHEQRTVTKVVHRIRMLQPMPSEVSWECPEGRVHLGKRVARDVREHLSGLGYSSEPQHMTGDAFAWYHTDSRESFAHGTPSLDHAAIVIGVNPTVFLVIDQPIPFDLGLRYPEFWAVWWRNPVQLPHGVLDGTRLPVYGQDESHFAEVHVGVVGEPGLVQIDARRPGEVTVGDILVRWESFVPESVPRESDQTPWVEHYPTRWIEFLASRFED